MRRRSQTETPYTEQLCAERERLLRLCATLSGDRQAAEDLTQETLLLAWKLAYRLERPEGYRSWLNAIARTVSRSGTSGGHRALRGVRFARLTDVPLRGSAWRTRQRISAYKAWGYFARMDGSSPLYVAHYRGDAWVDGTHGDVQPANGRRLLLPTAILTDYDTASAAEDFLIYLDKAPQVTRVGRRTYGSTGQPLMLTLPGNIQARICAKRDTYPDGRDFVGGRHSAACGG